MESKGEEEDGYVMNGLVRLMLRVNENLIWDMAKKRR